MAGDTTEDPEDGHELPFESGEKRLLADLVRSLRHMIADGADTSLRRLHPTAYVDDEERDAAWQLLARTELDDRHLAALAAVERSLERGRATTGELNAWLTSINSLRLVLGTQLGVEEDQQEPDLSGEDADRWAVYEWLGSVLEWVVRQLSEAI